MVLSTREKYVLIGTLAAVGALMLDRVIFPPRQREELQAKRSALTAELSRAQNNIANRRKASQTWGEMTRTGMKSDPAEAESQVLHAIGDWAQEAGLTLEQVRPERQPGKTLLPETVFQASARGPMNGIAKLLWRLQTAGIPIRITELNITARKEGFDDLAVQLRLSTVYSASPVPVAAPAASAASTPGRASPTASPSPVRTPATASAPSPAATSSSSPSSVPGVRP